MHCTLALVAAVKIMQRWSTNSQHTNPAAVLVVAPDVAQLRTAVWLLVSLQLAQLSVQALDHA